MTCVFHGSVPEFSLMLKYLYGFPRPWSGELIRWESVLYITALTLCVVVLICVRSYLMWTGKTINYSMVLSNAISRILREIILFAVCRRNYKKESLWTAHFNFFNITSLLFCIAGNLRDQRYFKLIYGWNIFVKYVML